VRDYASSQIGALAAIAAGEGATLSHVKPHRALYVLCSREPTLRGAQCDSSSSGASTRSTVAT
jgi:lactam utilization protein B